MTDRRAPGGFPAGTSSLSTSTLSLVHPGEWAVAVAKVHGPQLVLAGPGTGKTEFLVRRVAHLIEERDVAGAEVLVLTFSRRAAADLTRRITEQLHRPASSAGALTFHGFARLLTETYLDRLSRYSTLPSLLTAPEYVALVARLLAKDDPGHWPVTFRGLLHSPTFVREVANFLTRCRERLLSGPELAELARSRPEWRALPALLDTYDAELNATSRIDYATLVAEAVGLLDEPTVAAAVRSQFPYVVVDEWQDTSPAQARLSQRLVGEGGNLTVAGDPLQSIYSFRGADPGNVERFASGETAGPSAVWLLTSSFRVPEEILAAAHRLAAPVAGDAMTREIIPAPHPGRVDVHVFDQRSAEAEWIASEVERAHLVDGIPLGDIAVLVRSTRRLLPELSRALERRRLPHDRPDTRLVDHPAVQVIYDLVVAARGSDAGHSEEGDRAVRRLLLGPLLAVPLGRERQLARQRRRERAPWPDVLGRDLPEAAGLAELLAEPAWAHEGAAVEGFWHVWDRLPGLERIVADPTRADFRLAWSTFARTLEGQAERDPTITLGAYLDAAASDEFEADPLLAFSGRDSARLVLTTLHQAKGLEFDTVFVADAVEGVFPDKRRTYSFLRPELLASDGPADALAQAAGRLHEEMRLAYTAVTRARRRVVWTATTAGIDEGERRPSRFLLAAAGVRSFDEITSPPSTSQPPGTFAPLTTFQAEAQLRRMVAEPEVSPARRLAAVAILATSGRWDPRLFAGVPEPGSDAGLVGDDLRLSPSQATSYAQCPRRYALERRLKAVPADSPYLAFGGLVHRVLEQAEAEALAAGQDHATLEAARRHLDEVWEAVADFGSEAMNFAWRRRAEDLLRQLYESWPGGDAELLRIEHELRMDLDGVEWMGRADRIERLGDGSVRIVDYKSGKTPVTVSEAKTSLQLGYYFLAAQEDRAVTSIGQPGSAQLWFPAATKGPAIRSFEPAQAGAVRTALVEVSRAISAEEWAPVVSRHCDRCRVKLVCPAWPEGREAYR